MVPLSSLRRQAPSEILLPYLVKNIIFLVLEGLETLHRYETVHTGMLFSSLLQHPFDQTYDFLSREQAKQYSIRSGQ